MGIHSMGLPITKKYTQVKRKLSTTFIEQMQVQGLRMDNSFDFIYRLLRNIGDQLT